MLEGLLVVVALGATVIVGTTIGRRYSVAPPVLLLVMGGLLALIPQLSDVRLPAAAVLVIFLPGILYWESLNTSLREIRANIRVILLSAIGLVIATMVVLSYSLQAIGVASASAWILGAVLAPTDAAAVAGLAKRMPRRNLTTLRAESLINDGTALVLFAVAVSMLVDDTSPSLLAITGDLIWSIVGGVIAGLVTGALFIWIRRRIDDPLREGGLSILTPFAAFFVGEQIHASGVVAVVVVGLVHSYAGPRVIRARSRVQAFAFWSLSTFIVNGSLFVLVGLQIPAAARRIDNDQMGKAVGIAFAAAAVVIVTRIVWIHAAAGLIRLFDRRSIQRTRRLNWKVRTAYGWAGFRGAVSLAAALAVPSMLSDGTPYPDRDLIVFVTSVVILTTILVQGLTLPMVVRWAGLSGDNARRDEARHARIRAAEAGLAALPAVARSLSAPAYMTERVRGDYELAVSEARSGDGHSELTSAEQLERRLRLGVLEHERLAVTAMRDRREIDDIVMRELQASLDVTEIGLLGPPRAD
ncbi:monovalent cation:H+ antiporter, CPA1 family [Asanoa hainanensis]|uniref:Monovalent cation:H+ antiporter, CPA1 family n=1 Tax=Asanoa hainanensis TaxID=560556 RepID=A0A239NZ66_9ACTN|nr:Na+/H+ antiporter [Asanoa hainanensis]SNT60181.1 monovalent cation:H+ antiporter, CPA1 family [Asanoa hainanensis]